MMKLVAPITLMAAVTRAFSPHRSSNARNLPMASASVALMAKQPLQDSQPPQPFRNAMYESAPSVALEEYYKANMSKEKAPLFRNWEAYYEHLPIREVSGERLPLKLCDCAFWANDEDIEAMAQCLEKVPDKARASVVYLAAPSCSGKTASVLPAFLNSVKSERQGRFTHYLYLSFATNGWNHFQASDRSAISESSEQTAMRQGAEFMLTCLTNMLLLKDTSAFEISAMSDMGSTDSKLDVFGIFHSISINPSPREELKIDEDLQNLLDLCLVGTRDMPRLLIHLDEHEKMSGHSEEIRNSQNRLNFRKGAMQLLARQSRIKCVATYTKVLSILPHDAISAVCREPCQLPVFDIWKFDKEEQKLGLDRYKIEPEENDELRRCWAALLFRLSATLGNRVVLLHYHVCKMTGHGMDDHFASVYGRRSVECNYDVKNMLSMEKVRVPGLYRWGGSLTYLEAVRLTAGVNEGSDDIEEKFNIGLTLGRNVIVGDWWALLRSELYWKDRTEGCDGFMEFIDAREDFTRCLSSADFFQVVLPGSPLKAAYAWSLFALSANTGRLQFGEFFACEFEAVHYNKARLFSESAACTGCMVHPNALDRNTLYSARELEKASGAMPTKRLLPLDPKGEKLLSSNEPVPINFRAAHPLCDIFFVTNDNCLFMIDVTSASGRKVDETAERLGDWTAKYFGLDSDKWRDRVFLPQLNRDRAEQLGNRSFGKRARAWFRTLLDQKNKPLYSCQGIVLAPFCSKNSNLVNDVYCVRGEDARNLLGAVDPIFRWFAPAPISDTKVAGDTEAQVSGRG